MQDKLGDLQDSVVARDYIRRLGLEADPGAQAYLAARDAERVTLLAELPSRWDQVASPAYRRQLLDLIAQL